MTNKPTLFLTLLLGLGSTAARAQADFRPGYVVLPSGDTLRGEIDLRGAKRMAQICLFRPQVSSTATTRYTPAELKAYGQRGGLRYETCLLPTAPATPVVFMQVLVTGRATLYSFEDDDNHTRYFFRQGGGAIVELIQSLRIDRDGPLPIQEQTFPFRQVLSKAFADCLAVQALLPKATLTYSQLVAIFTRYNGCSGSSAASKTAATRSTEMHLGIVAGLQQANATLDDGGEVIVSSGLRPVVGVGLLVNPAAFNSRLALRFEALYQTQLLENEYPRTNVVISTATSHKAAISLKTLRIPLLLRYTFPAGRVRPYVQGGGEAAILLDTKQAFITEITPALGGTGTDSRVRQIEMRSLGLGPTAGIGLLIPTGAGALQLEGRINWLDSASQAANLLGGPATVSFLLGYNLGRLSQ